MTLLTLALLLSFSCVSRAQTIITEHADGTMSTNVLANTTSSWTSIESVLGSLGISTNPTNYALATGAGFGPNSEVAAWAVLTMNVNNYVGTVLGVDHLWYGGKKGSANIVSGGLNLSIATHPLQWFTSSTNTWAYNLKVTPFALAMVGSPLNGTSNDGGLCAVNRVGANVDIFSFSGWNVGALLDYGNRVGAGAYSGSWVDIGLSIRKGF